MLEDVPHTAGITKAVAGGALLGNIVPHQRLGLLRQHIALAAAHFKNGHHLVHRVVGEEQKPVEPALKAGVGVNKLLHQVGVARHDHHQIVPMVLHGLQHGIDGLLSEIIFRFAIEGVCLVDKQHAAHGLFDGLLGLESRLAHIAGHKAAAVHLHQLSLAENAQTAVNAGHHAGHHGLSRAGITGEHHMERHVGSGQVMLPAQFVDLHHVNEAANLVFHHVKTDIGIQLCQKIFHLFRRRQLLLWLALLLTGGHGSFLFAVFLGCFRRFGSGRDLRRGRRTPEIAVHALHAVLRHGADHVQLLQNDLILLIHLFCLLNGRVLHGPWPGTAAPPRNRSACR